MFFNHLVNNLVKCGNRERAFRRVYLILKKVKLKLKKNPLLLCSKSLESCETRLEFRMNDTMRFMQKKRKRGI